MDFDFTLDLVCIGENMEKKSEKEEYLEVLWYLRESDTDTLAAFQSELGERYDAALVKELSVAGIVALGNDTISLTEDGIVYTRQLIRSHRIAERLVHDVLGVPYEDGACEFEHIINPELVDSICTLLGHPRECPHGMPIPEGECCRQHAQVVESTVLPLTQLGVGESGKIAYVYAKNDQQLHKLENLLIRPGATVKLHQCSPSFVIECENSVIALDEQVADSIHVWVGPGREQSIRPHGRRRQRRGLRHGTP